MRCHGTKACAIQGAATHALRASAPLPTIILYTFRFVHFRSLNKQRGWDGVDAPTNSFYL